MSKIKNGFEIRGSSTAVFLTKSNGVQMETIIDTADLPKVMEMNNTWFAVKSMKTGSFYVVGEFPKVDGKRRKIKLHRYLLDVPNGLQVDHVNCDTLDNRRGNLRMCSHSENQQNHKGVIKSNKSGARGVFWRKDKQKWMAYISINKKVKHLGYYCDFGEAARVASDARAKHMPFSQEALNKRI